MSQIQIAEKWFGAFNQQKIEDLLSLYDDNAEHFSPRLLKNYPDTKGLIKGKAAMRNWWQSAFDKMPSLRYHPIYIREEKDKIHLEYLRTVDNESDVMVKEYLQIANGKIVFSKVVG